jgi:hypothetical protein
MTDGYTRYEETCEIIRRENAELIDRFEEWLERKGLSKKTVDMHCENIRFYVNHFLLYEDTVRPEDGVGDVGMFLGYWFIRKALWATKASMKSNAASLKKFYGFMLEIGKIRQEDLDELKYEIKEGLPEWLATLARFDDPSIEDPADVWDL